MARTYYTPPKDPPLRKSWRVLAFWGTGRARVYAFDGKEGTYTMDPVHAACWRITLIHHNGGRANLPNVPSITEGFELVERYDREPFPLDD